MWCAERAMGDLLLAESFSLAFHNFCAFNFIFVQFHSYSLAKLTYGKINTIAGNGCGGRGTMTNEFSWWEGNCLGRFLSVWICDVFEKAGKDQWDSQAQSAAAAIASSQILVSVYIQARVGFGTAAEKTRIPCLATDKGKWSHDSSCVRISSSTSAKI